jgi:hypothetical protein
MADQSELISRHVQPTHYLSQWWLAERLLALSVAKPTRLRIVLLYLYLQMAYKFVIKAHESSHVPKGISDKKHTDFFFKVCVQIALLWGSDVWHTPSFLKLVTYQVWPVLFWLYWVTYVFIAVGCTIQGNKTILNFHLNSSQFTKQTKFQFHIFII